MSSCAGSLPRQRTPTPTSSPRSSTTRGPPGSRSTSEALRRARAQTSRRVSLPRLDTYRSTSGSTAPPGGRPISSASSPLCSSPPRTSTSCSAPPRSAAATWTSCCHSSTGGTCGRPSATSGLSPSATRSSRRYPSAGRRPTSSNSGAPRPPRRAGTSWPHGPRRSRPCRQWPRGYTNRCPAAMSAASWPTPPASIRRRLPGRRPARRRSGTPWRSASGARSPRATR